MKLNWKNFIRRRKFLLFVGWGKHLFFVRSNGDFMACGSNRDGQLSLGDKKDRSIPEVVTTFERMSIADVATSQKDYSLFITDKGIPWACGSNDLGQLSITCGFLPTEPLENFSSISIARKVNLLLPFPVRIVRVYCDAWKSSYWLTIDGDVYSCGYNSSGQLGHGSFEAGIIVAQRIESLNKIVNITTGYQWAIFHKEDGSLFACGSAYDGPFALGDTTSCSTPTKITFFQTNELKVTYVVSTCHSMYYLTENSQTYVCGSNRYGELGIGKEINCIIVPKLSKVLSGMELFCGGTSLCIFVYKKDGKVYGVGENRGTYDSFSRMGLGKMFTIVYQPQEIVELTGKNIVQIETSINSTYVISREGHVYGVGEGSLGQLMDGRTKSCHKFIPLGIKVKKKRVSGELKERAQRLSLIAGRSIFQIPMIKRFNN